MLKQIFFFYLLLSGLSLAAQYNIHLEIRSLPPNHPSGATVYIAGSFNGWNPQNEQYRFKKEESGNYYLDLKLEPGSYEYKITRGGWDKVECQKNGAGISNRVLKLNSDTTIQLNIEEWQDRFPVKPRAHSACSHVKIMDTAFLIPQLNRVRRIWVYLPEGYDATKNRYPVLYMHDGQNVFDDATSFSGEWGVDECLDSMKIKCIVVAVDNGGLKRLNEYCPYDFSLTGIAAAYSSNKGEGSLYVDFLANTLKPFIDKNYRTLKNKNNTFVAGSSMGGLISLYAVLKYPKVFGGAGVFSPAFWVGPKIFDDIKSKGGKVKSRIYFYAGGQEGESMVPDTQKAFDEMSKVSTSKMTTVIRDDGKHNEPRWRIEFPAFYKWLVK
ncbi:MAG: alpha/beta hydrolase [Sphingobacteriales bacterium]|nr:alpha/beta hydrolase [Sphingobacteriales bacterium]